MLRRAILFVVLTSLCCLATWAQERFSSIKVGETVYTDVTVIDANATSIIFKHSTGMANVKLRYLPEELQKRFHYDSENADRAEKQLDADTAAYQRITAQRAWDRRAAEKLAEAEAEAKQIFRLADPVFPSSPISHKSPLPELTEWYSEKPENLKEHWKLFFFWHTQSEPCKRAIPELNAVQARFANDLNVVGITPESAKQVEQMEQPQIKFAVAGDPRSNLWFFANFNSIPSVLLVDPQGIVRYQGHPAALDTAALEQYIGHPALDISTNKPAKPAGKTR